MSQDETIRRVRVPNVDDLPLYQPFGRREMRKRVFWHSAGPAVASRDLAVKYALANASFARAESLAILVDAERKGPQGGGPRDVLYAIVELKRPPFWCCESPWEMGRVVELFRCNVEASPDDLRYDLCREVDEEAEDV